MPGRIAAGGGGAAARRRSQPLQHRHSPSFTARPAGMLSFLARLSGRRRHVRSSGCQQQQSGSSRSCAAGGPGAASAGGSTAAAAGSPTAAMEQQQHEEELYHCCRCRGSRSCSCALLGLDETSYNPVSEQERPAQCSSYARLHRHVESDSKYGSPRKLDCGCADRDVLRRRPPEKSNGGISSSTSSRISSVVSGLRSSLGLVLPPYLATLLILSFSFIGMADACSSRSTPKPRPPTPTPRPNITFHMYTCPPDYAEWYCLNGATCFTVKIVDSLLYNCLCANGYIGQRCEFKDLDGSYLPSRQRVMLETASIAGAVTIAVFLAVITFISIYIHCKRKQKELRTSSGVDAVDGPSRDPERRPFCSHSRALMSFMAKNPNSSTAPSIEQTRMPTPWSPLAETSTRMASINENNRPTSQ